MSTLNRWFTADAVLWSAAAVSFLLLVLTVPVASLVTSARRDSLIRAGKIVFYVVLILLFLLPCLILLTGEAVNGLPCGLYLLFFPLFCYYLGRRIGHRSGERYMAERIGLDMFDNTEEAQDRLYESRLRLPSPEAVNDSIVELSRPASSGSVKPSPSTPRGGKKGGAAKSEILEVEVEEI